MKIIVAMFSIAAALVTVPAPAAASWWRECNQVTRCNGFGQCGYYTQCCDYQRNDWTGYTTYQCFWR